MYKNFKIYKKIVKKMISKIDLRLIDLFLFYFIFKFAVRGTWTARTEAGGHQRINDYE